MNAPKRDRGINVQVVRVMSMAFVKQMAAQNTSETEGGIDVQIVRVLPMAFVKQLAALKPGLQLDYLQRRGC